MGRAQEILERLLSLAIRERGVMYGGGVKILGTEVTPAADSALLDAYYAYERAKLQGEQL